jgi:hypothetical protein
MTRQIVWLVLIPVISIKVSEIPKLQRVSMEHMYMPLKYIFPLLFNGCPGSCVQKHNLLIVFTS